MGIWVKWSSGQNSETCKGKMVEYLDVLRSEGPRLRAKSSLFSLVKG